MCNTNKDKRRTEEDNYVKTWSIWNVSLQFNTLLRRQVTKVITSLNSQKYMNKNVP